MAFSQCWRQHAGVRRGGTHNQHEVEGLEGRRREERYKG
jgi:hypothetical protein